MTQDVQEEMSGTQPTAVVALLRTAGLLLYSSDVTFQTFYCSVHCIAWISGAAS